MKVGRARNRGGFPRAAKVTWRLASVGHLNCHVAGCEQRAKPRPSSSTGKMAFRRLNAEREAGAEAFGASAGLCALPGGLGRGPTSVQVECCLCRETFFDLQPHVKLSVTQSSSCNSSFVPLSSISFFLLESITHLPAFRYQAPLGKGMMCRGRFYFPITPFPAYTKCLEVGIGCCL